MINIAWVVIVLSSAGNPVQMAAGCGCPTALTVVEYVVKNKENLGGLIYRCFALKHPTKSD